MLKISEVCYPANLYQPRHAHSHASVTFVVAGSLEESVGRVKERGLALAVVVKPAGVEHDDRFGSAGARTIQIGLTDADAAGLERRGGLLENWRWVPAAQAAGAFVRLIAAMQAGGATAGADVQLAAWDALAAIPLAPGEDTMRHSRRGGHRRHAATPAAAMPAVATPGAAVPAATPSAVLSRATRSASRPPRWLERVREYADDCAGELPLVRDLATTAGVHPVHLAREFRRYYGVTLSTHLQQRRVQAAADLLASSDEPVARVAARCGFADQSHLGRQLRACAGVTPAGLRKLTRRPMLQPF